MSYQARRKKGKGEREKHRRGQDQMGRSVPTTRQYTWNWIDVVSLLAKVLSAFSRRTGGCGEASQPLSMEGHSCQNLTWITFQFLNKRTSALWGLFLPKGWVRVTGLHCSLLEHGVPMTISLPWSWPWPGRKPSVDDAAASNSDAHSFLGGVR